jgi:hypothetical protein
MYDFNFYDLYASKGAEYLIVIAFLIALIFAWRYLNQPPHGSTRG